MPACGPVARAGPRIGSRLTGITFTPHALVREEHLKITGTEFYCDVIRNIASFLEVRKAMGKLLAVYLNIFDDADASRI